MNRWSFLTSAGKRTALAAGIALLVVGAAPRAAFAQDPQQDPLKFNVSGPVTLIFQVKADQAGGWEEFWAYTFGLMAKSSDPDLKSMGESLSASMSKVDQPPFDAAGGAKATVYVFQLSSVNTKYSYSPREILYTYLKAGQEGAPPRSEVDPMYKKLQDAFLGVSSWKLIKVGGK